jgi:hypothetical protein
VTYIRESIIINLIQCVCFRLRKLAALVLVVHRHDYEYAKQIPPFQDSVLQKLGYDHIVQMVWGFQH